MLETITATEQPVTGELTGKRILVVMPSIPLYGMERKNIQIMKELRKQGADVLFITQETYGGNIQREVERAGCRWTTASFNKLLHLSKNPFEMAAVLRAWATSAWQLWRICKQYRPTHIHLTDFTFFLYSWPVVAWLPQPVVFSLPVPPDTDLTPFKQRLSNFIWRRGVERVCDLIVCNSQYTLSQLRKIGVKTKNARVIYNPYPERTVPQPSDAPKVDSDRFNIVFMGRISANKGVRELIDAALQIINERADVDFYLAGDYAWRNPFAEALINEVRDKGLEARIRFLGEVQDIMGLVKQCDLHVCPSTCAEAFGLVVLEAKHCGLPSVIFPSGGLTETVIHLTDGYICKDITAQSLYEGISYFLNNPDALHRAGQAAYDSQSRFSVEANTEAWCSFYNSRGLQATDSERPS